MTMQKPARLLGKLELELRALGRAAEKLRAKAAALQRKEAEQAEGCRELTPDPMPAARARQLKRIVDAYDLALNEQAVLQRDLAAAGRANSRKASNANHFGGK
ncbi:MAG: hypothetical protein KGL39_34970 [Patescibacteria group bacterium]|nr:hypothetical protein [Patescibacteria group bacterium]